jgi:hypothetical protein
MHPLNTQTGFDHALTKVGKMGVVKICLFLQARGNSI